MGQDMRFYIDDMEREKAKIQAKIIAVVRSLPVAKEEPLQTLFQELEAFETRYREGR